MLPMLWMDVQLFIFFDNQKFDLLVVDIQMPDADGFDLVSSFLDRFPDQRFFCF